MDIYPTHSELKIAKRFASSSTVASPARTPFRTLSRRCCSSNRLSALAASIPGAARSCEIASSIVDSSAGVEAASPSARIVELSELGETRASTSSTATREPVVSQIAAVTATTPITVASNFFPALTPSKKLSRMILWPTGSCPVERSSFDRPWSVAHDPTEKHKPHPLAYFRSRSDMSRH